MNTEEDGAMNAQRPSESLAHADSPEVESSVPTVDGELVDDTLPKPTHRSQWQRFKRWWQCHPRIPAPLQSRAIAVQVAKDLVAAVLRSPWRYLHAVVRGAVAGRRSWRQWITVRDYREAAEESGKLADKFTDIRELTLFRWKVTGAVIVAATLAGAVTRLVYGNGPLWIAAVAGSVGLAILGRRTDGSPGRKPSLSGQRAFAWTMDPQLLVDAFRDAKLIGKDESLRLVERATRVGDGWAITVDLPATRKAADVVKHREALASALAVDEIQLIAERVRGKRGHAGRAAMWVADEDPYSKPPLRTPLLNVSSWDAWRPVPFGRDARDRRIDLPLVWTSLLVGAIPRQGKTFATRLAAAGLILDPHTRLYVADFKAGKDWDAASQVAHRFLSGDDPEHVLALVDWLVELVAATHGRYRRMRALDEHVCPESKITPEMSRDGCVDMPITAIVLDEVQVPLEDHTPVTVQGKKLTAGEYVGELLTWLAKKGPAAGVVLILATQRPDSKTIPSGLRAVLGSRFALRVMDWRDSNIVLGEQMNTRGHDASKLLPSHKGVGILRPDGGTEAGADTLALTVCTYFMPGPDWLTICQHARQLRMAAGTLTGQAAGHDVAPVRDHAAATNALGEAQEGGNRQARSVELPEPLESVANYLDEDGREFVPTAELLDALNAEANTFGRAMTELGCRPVRERIQSEDDSIRQVRGYYLTDIRAATDAYGTAPEQRSSSHEAPA